jgi:hypothetical protein
MCNRRAIVLWALLLAPTANARAGTVDGSVSFVMNGRSDPRDGNVYTVVPVYAGLHLSVRELSVPYADDLRLELDGWLGGLLGQPYEGQRFIGDLNVFSIEARFARRHVLVRLGRQIAIGGAAHFTHLDGASVTLEHAGVGLTAFGGVPVVPRFGVKVGDAVGGGRVFYRFSYESQLGVSFIHIEDGGRTARQDLALDFRARPFRLLTLTGLGVLSLVERDMAEIDIAATLALHRRLDVRADFRQQRPDLFIPRSSIFSVFSNTNRKEAGGVVDARPHARVELDADYHVILDEMGTGHRAGVRGQVRFGPVGELTLGSELRLLRLPDKGYEQARLYVMFRILPSLIASLDGDAFYFTTPVNGRDWSLTGAASVGWDFRPAWRLVVSGAGSSTPFIQGGWDAMVKLAYNASYRIKERH